VGRRLRRNPPGADSAEGWARWPGGPEHAMNDAVIVVGSIRVLSALPVLRWPFWGALFAIFVDLSDLALFSYLGLGWPPDYQHFDKIADLAYLITFMIVALRWSNPERRIAATLFGFRVAGMVAFEWTANRAILFAFPNVFEFWFVLVAARDRFRPGYRLTPSRAALWLAGLLALKLPQEYLLHVDRRLDQYALTDIVSRVVQHVKHW
jgi:hypothetical protein